MKIDDLAAAGFETVISSDQVTDADSPTRPLLYPKISVPVVVSFGELIGSRTIFASGRTSVALRKFGSIARDDYEEYLLNARQFRGIADVTPPRLTATAPKSVSSTALTLSGAVEDASQIAEAAATVSLAVRLNEADASGAQIAVAPPNAKGSSAFSISGLTLNATLPKGANSIHILAADSSGNTAERLLRTAVASNPSSKRSALLLLPDAPASPLTVASVAPKTGSIAAFLTNEEELFGMRFVRSVKEVAITGP